MTYPKKITAALLAELCDQAFQKFPNSCSHAVWHVIRGYKEEQEYLTANQLITRISSSPEWEEVQLTELGKLASEGALVVGGLKEKEHGHVIAVYPGEEKKRGGYDYYNRNTKKNEKLAEKGSYARCLSTSIGSWPGAKSNGEKTVWDPWAKENKFKSVRFWKCVGSQTGTVTVFKLKRHSMIKSTSRKHRLMFKFNIIKATDKTKWRMKSFSECFDAINHKWEKVLSIR